MSHCDKDSSPVRMEVVWLDDTGGPQAELPATTALSIGNVAKMFDVSKLTLRIYELRGLIARRQYLGRTRVYGWADCERLAFIIKCRKAGLPLRDIITVIKATDADEVATGGFLVGQEKCMALVDRLERRRKVLDEALAELAHIHALLGTKRQTPDAAERRD